ncbi:MAG: hypothetical protein RBT68_13815, partial [Spirochaetia bacterium]|nr:hypothetical protein [Spirochaetia bacterium]
MGAIELKRWRDALIADSGDLLINAYKRWVGPIRTPFNKHDLMASLEAYLRKPATQDLIVELMDREDRLVAAVLHFGGDMDTPALERFVDGRTAKGRIAGAHITILRERLVIYAYKDGTGKEFISLVPALHDCLSKVLQPDDLIGAGEARHLDARLDEATPAIPEPDPFAAFCALVSCGVHFQPAFKNLSVPVKRAGAMLAQTAPRLVPGGEAIKSAMQALLRAGAFVMDSRSRPMADPQSFIGICDAAGVLAPAYLVVADAELPCSTAMAASGAVAVLAALPPALALAPASMERVAGVVLLRHAGASAGDPGTATLGAVEAIQLAGVLSDRFTESGLLRELSGGYLRSTAAAAAFVQLCTKGTVAGQERPGVVVEGSHEIRILPEASPSVRAYIASVARLESTGTVWTATLDRAAAMAAYSFGFTAEAMATFLETHSGRPLPQGFRFSLDAWESEARAVRVRTGIVVALDGHLASILDHAPGAAALVREKLGEGVYLLAARDLETAGKALASAGIPVDLRGEILAATRQAAMLEVHNWRLETSFGHVGSPDQATSARTFPEPLAFSSNSCKLDKEPSQLLDHLLSRIDEMDLPEKARTELADRVQARLILSDDQLEVAAGSRHTGGEISVGALDYQGKNRLVEASLRAGFVIELIWTDESGQRCTTRGVPVDVSRSPGLDMVSVMDHRTRSVVSLPLEIGRA